ncbi:MAG: iron-containing alcohol dehydrogenase [Spirochaetales bacterium]|nr:iron-containing alcohol dehydrogenase [Spirochaetales bacterium]
MNPARKIYCRIFQKCFHLALPFLPYREPKILECIDEISDILALERRKKPLIITDRGIDRLSLASPLRQLLEDTQIGYAYFPDVVANPTTETVDQALAVYRHSGCDCLIAIGGGSSIDTAKAVGILVAKPKKTLSEVKGILKVHTRIPLLIAIPTTAGTGSETTLAAVIVDAETRHKYAINDFPLIPRYAVLDEELTLSLPPAITAETGLDALTHAVEAYIGRSTTALTRRAAKNATRIIFRYLERAYQDGNDHKARRYMLKASYLAGIAFTRSYVGYVHAIAHSLGGKYNVAHGKANAIILPMILEAYGSSIHRKLKKLAIVTGLAEKETNEAVAAQLFISEIREMKTRMGLGDRIEEIREEDIPEMAANADREANPLYPVPVLWDARDLERFYYDLMGKKG